MTIEYIVIAVGIVAFLVIAGLTYWAKRSSAKSEPDAWRLPGTGTGTGGGPGSNTVLAAESQATEDWWGFSSEEANLQKVTETVTKPVPKKARIAKAKVELKKAAGTTKTRTVSKNKKPAAKAKKLPVKKTTSRKTTK